MKKHTAFIMSIMLTAAMFAGCTLNQNETIMPTAAIQTPSPTVDATDIASNSTAQSIDENYTDRDKSGDYGESTATKVVLSSDTASVTGEGAVFEDGILNITQEGVYIITGMLLDGQIRVEANKDSAKVQLVLDNVSLCCCDGCPIYVVSADKVFITLAQNSVNSLSDTANYVFEEGEDEPNATLFSKEDLVINGSGTLNITANYNDGIASKDSLKITGGTINISSVGDGIRGKDNVSILDGQITIDAGADGIKSTNATDEGRGYVVIDGGTMDITAVNDGIQAESIMQVGAGEINIVCGGGSANASTDQSDGWGFWGNPGKGTESEDTASAKGLKGGSALFIFGGSITVDSSDDSLHTNGSMRIEEGDIDLTSGDDGIHADNAAIISGGAINILKSYEGIEGAAIQILGGSVSVASSDDGLNAGGGSDGSAVNGRPGQGNFASNGAYSLTISGGQVYVEADGDGLDSNGDLYVSGGTTVVNGPVNSGNGAIDSNGTASISGGVLIAAGSAGMAESFDSSSTQCSLMFQFSNVQQKGTLFSILDTSASVVLAYAPTRAYQNVVVSAPTLVLDGTYSVNVGGEASGSELAYGLFTQNASINGATKLLDVSLSSVTVGISEDGSTLQGGFGNFGGGGFGGKGQAQVVPSDGVGGGQPPHGGFEGGKAPAPTPSTGE